MADKLRRCQGCGRKLRPNDGAYCTHQCQATNAKVRRLPTPEKRPQTPPETA